jgi:hypothetical protein
MWQTERVFGVADVHGAAASLFKHKNVQTAALTYACDAELKYYFNFWPWKAKTMNGDRQDR